MQTKLLNQSILNQVHLERYKAAHIKVVAKALNKLRDHIALIVSQIDLGRLSNINATIAKINSKVDSVINKIETDCTREYKNIISSVATNEKNLLHQTPDEKDNSIFPIVISSFVLGKTLHQHFRDLKTTTKNNIAAQIRAGSQDNENIRALIQRIRGTRSRRFKDGVFNTTLNNTDSILRTAIQGYVNRTKLEVWNLAGIAKYQWISVLDNRTSAVCRGRSNKIYRVGQGVLPPAHFRCRSIVIPYSANNPVPLSYAAWLLQQDRSEVEEILGKQKADLFLSGKVPLDKFYVANGRELTLQELLEKFN